MANEFKIRKGYKALASSEITGSLKIKGSTTIDSGGDTNPLTLQGSSHKYLDITTTGNRQVGIRMTDDSVTYTMGLHGGEEAFKISKNSEFGVNDYFTITEDGNVGIGTVYPSTRLGISGSADINGDLTVNGGRIILDPDSAGTVLFWRESDSTTIAGQLRGYANRGDIYLYKDGIKLVELTPLTDSFIPALHIGGTTGATDGVLQTTGDINIDGNAIFTGDVGIGTTSPDRALHVKASAIVSTKLEGPNPGHLVDLVNSNASPIYNGIRFTQGTTSKMAVTHIADGTTRGYVQISNTWVAGSEILVVDGRTSRVGIGTNSPTAELQVAGDVVVDGTITAQEFHTEFVSASILFDSGSTKFGDTSDDIHSFSGSLRVTGSGDHYFIGGGGVGIGTTSTSRMLHVIGNTEIEGTLFVEAANNNIRLLDTNDATVNFSVGVNGLFQIRDVAAATTPFQIEKAAPDNSLRIEANGNIGIGTNNPTAELQVAGDVVVDGTITAQEFHTEFVSASILYESGSSQFGNSADDNHIFTGSIKVTNLQTNGETLFEAERHPNFYFKIQDYAQVDHRVNGNVNAFTVRNTATTQAAPVLTLGHGTVGSPHISTYSTNEDLTIDPNGTGKTRIKGSTDVTGSLDVTGNNTALSVRNINPNSSDTGIEIRGARNSGIGSPTSYIHFNNNDDDSGGLHNLARIYGAMASTGGNDGTLTLQSWNGSAYVDGIRINAAGNVGIGSTGPVEKLDVGGSIKLTGTIKVGSNIEGTEAVTLIKDIITDQSYEHKAFYNPEVLNAFAGADHWATITLTNAKESDRTTTMTSLGESPFRVGGLTAQPYFDVSETEIVIEIDHTADPLKYHAIVGMQFTAQQWTPERVKIEAYNGTTWTTGLDTTNHSETTVAVKFSLGSAGVKKTKFTLGNPRSAAGYVRISKIFGYDFKGVSFLDDVKSGTYFIDRYDDSGHYSNIYPATSSVYSLGKSNLRYANIYADTGSFDGNVGIGTTSPAEKLHVVGNISGSDVDINDWGSVSASLAAIQTAGGVNGTGSASKVAIWSDSDTLTSDTNLHWDSSNDRLGIGTTSPSAMLNIVDSNPKIVLEDSDNTGTFGQIRQQAGNLQFLSNNNTSNGTIQFKLYDGTNTTDVMYIASSGNVGIGTTSPLHPLHVNGVISGSDTYINGWNSVSASLSTLTTDLDVLENKNLISGSAQIASDISGSITSFSGSIAGRVETNESSISSLNGATGSYLLNTTDTLTGNLTVTGTLTAQEFHTEFVSASILFDSGSTKFGDSSDDVHNFTGSVNVKSLSTGAKLTIEDDTAKTELQHNLHAFRIKVDPDAADSNSNFRVEIDGSEKLRIGNNGRVGIGITSPAEKLHVAGNISGSDVYINDGGSVAASLSTLTTDLDVLEGKTLISSSAQIASEISGSFTSTSASLAAAISAVSTDFADIENKPTLVSSSNQIASDISGSFTSTSASIAQDIVTNYLRNTTDTLTGDLTVTGTLTAQEFHTEFVSASIIYESGSTKFGDTSDDIHSFTGDLELTGSLNLISGSSINHNSNDISTWHLSTDKFYTGDEDVNPEALFFKPDGTKMYILGRSGDDIDEYALSTAWDVTTATYTDQLTGLNSSPSSEANPYGMFISPNGLEVYIVGHDQDQVIQWTMSVAWDISTATYTREENLTDSGGTFTNPHGIHFKPDGTKFWVIGLTEDSIQEYTLSTAWDISTLSLGNSFNLLNIYTIDKLNVTLTGDIASSEDLFFSEDGYKVWIVDTSLDCIHQLNLSTAWDITTAQYSGRNARTSVYQATVDGLYVNEANKKAFTCSNSGDYVRTYNIGGIFLENSNDGGVGIENGLIVKGDSTFNGFASFTNLLAVNTFVYGIFQTTSTTTLITGNGGTVNILEGNVTSDSRVDIQTNILWGQNGQIQSLQNDNEHNFNLQRPINGATTRVNIGLVRDDEGVEYPHAGVVKIKSLAQTFDHSGSLNIGRTLQADGKADLELFDLEGTTVFLDTFTEASTTALESHTPDTGSGWTKVFDDGNTNTWNVIGGTGVAQLNANDPDDGIMYLADTTPSSVNYEVRVDFLRRDSGDDVFLIIIKYKDANNYYALQWSATYSSHCRLIRVEGGSIVNIQNNFGNGVMNSTTDSLSTGLKLRYIDGKLMVWDIDPTGYAAFRGTYEVTTDFNDGDGGTYHKVGMALGDLFGGTLDSMTQWKIDKFEVKNLSDVSVYNAATTHYIKNGKVGIGTDSPAVNLDILSGASGILRIKDVNSTDVRLAASGNASSVGTQTDHDFRVNTNNTPRITVSNDGKVGIGTTSPAKALEVNGSVNDDVAIKITNTRDNNGTDDADAAATLLFQAASNNGYFRVHGAPTDLAADHQIDIGSTASTSFLTFSPNSGTGGEKMRITSAGNVGIGTDSPNEKLHVNGGTSNVVANFESTDAEAYISFKDSSTTNTDTVFLGAEGNNMTFYAGSASSERMRIDFNGNVGIGVTPSVELHIKRTDTDNVRLRLETTNTGTSTIQFADSDDGNVGIIQYDHSVNAMVFKTNGSNERLRIDSSGNVGIGTESPSNTTHIYKNATIGTIDSTTTANAGLRIQDSSASMYLDGNSIVTDSVGYITTTGSNYFALGTNNTTRIHIDGSGNVGIGTTSPAAVLDVNAGTIKPTSNLILGESAYSDSTNYVGLKTTFHTGGTDYMILSGKTDGNTYISAKDTNGVYVRGGGDFSSNQIFVPDGSYIEVTTSNLRVTGDITAYYSSDERLKENKRHIENASEKIKKIGGYEFDWIQNEDIHLNEGRDIGVIAQEVEKVIPEVVTTRDNGYKAVKYEKLVALLIESNKELIDQNEKMLDRIKALESKLK